MISTQNLSSLPELAVLKSLFQSLALLDAIICPEWETRYHWFNAQWNAGESLAAMRNGQGDHYFCVFSSKGAVLKGFLHESPMNPYRVNPPKLWQGVLDNLPKEFNTQILDPAFSPLETTFCIWRSHDDSLWQCGDITYPENGTTDGSKKLLFLLDANPQTYQRWAESYYEQSVDLTSVQQIYQHKPLTQEIVKVLNPNMTLQDAESDIVEIGYETSHL